MGTFTGHDLVGDCQGKQPKMRGFYFFLVLVIAVSFANADSCTDLCDQAYKVSGIQDVKDLCYKTCGVAGSGSTIKLSTTCGAIMMVMAAAALKTFIGK